MGAYHQMGHDSLNIVLDPILTSYAGAILSPVNYSPDKVVEQCALFRQKLPDLEVVFDPQLYVPQSERGMLGSWPHKPSDLDTADLTSILWWTNVVDAVIDVSSGFEPDMICS